MSDAGGDVLAEEIGKIRSRGLHRRLRSRQGATDTTVTMEGRVLANFGSNNYLGLANHPAVVAASCAATARGGAGAGASRLIGGNHSEYDPLERGLARLKGTQASLVFAAGYMANLGAIGALAGEGDMIACDRLNHASLVDACRLSGARMLVYPHLDAGRLRETLERYRGRYRRALIVTDGLFSMDGDVAPLAELSPLAEEFNAWLYVDDAHGTGVLGERGAGALEHAGVVPGPRTIQMGTMSKALGSAGGFVAGTGTLRDFLVNRARTLVFSTGLPPGTAAAATAAMEIAEEEPWRRQRAREAAERLRAELRGLGLNVIEGPGPIVPVLLGGSERAVRWMEAIAERGCFVPGVRPPSVPEGEARLRISVMATHTDGQLEVLTGALASVARAEDA